MESSSIVLFFYHYNGLYNRDTFGNQATICTSMVNTACNVYATAGGLCECCHAGDLLEGGEGATGGHSGSTSQYHLSAAGTSAGDH